MIERFYVNGVHSPLSNFSPSLLVIDGESYATVEHYYQAIKTTSEHHRRGVRLAPTPGEAKRRGRRVPLRENWEEIKIPVMRRGLLHKFPSDYANSNTQYLMSTGAQFLVEGNDWHDSFWGVCSCPKHKDAGENWLGLLLMARRAEVVAT